MCSFELFQVISWRVQYEIIILICMLYRYWIKLLSTTKNQENKNFLHQSTKMTLDTVLIATKMWKRRAVTSCSTDIVCIHLVFCVQCYSFSSVTILQFQFKIWVIVVMWKTWCVIFNLNGCDVSNIEMSKILTSKFHPRM